MFCSHCGKELADDAFMCPNCGSPVGKSAPRKKSEPVADAKETGIAVIGFILAMFSFVTGIIFGAFFLCFGSSVVLLYILGAFTILPGIAAICLSAYARVQIRGTENALAKNLSITAIVFSSIALFFVFVIMCVCATTIEYY
ncbi:MAG: zinc-ribbon domain-containing protein [Clostridia bacterium]|nr:zinc-ribbon domain-containing protein [Clostridia bacterium]MDE6676161.1 zinc-ribbon domain-containing protein [Clostridia bacterium]